MLLMLYKSERGFCQCEEKLVGGKFDLAKGIEELSNQGYRHLTAMPTRRGIDYEPIKPDLEKAV